MLNAGLLANASAHAFVPSDFDATKVFVTVELVRQNVKRTLYADNLAAVIACSFMSNFGLLHPLNGGTPDNIVLVQTTGVVEKHVLPYFLDFNSVIDLEGADVINITVQFTAGALSGTYLVGNTTSYIDIVEMEMHGFEKVTPSIETNTIKSGESRVSFALGDNIRRIVLLNYDKNTVLAADAPMSIVTLSSDKVNYSKTNEQVMGERQHDFYMAYAEETLRRQCLVLYDGITGLLNKCQVELLLNSANVNTGKNVLVVWRNSTNAGLILHGTIKEEAAKSAHLAKNGINIPTAATNANLSNLNRV